MSEGASTINLFRVLLHSPPAAAMINGLKDTALRHFGLDARLRELAIMRTAWLMGAEYVWNHHTRPYVEHDLDLNPADVLEVRDWRSSKAFGPTEHAVLQLTDEMVLGRHGEVASDTLAKAVDVLSPAQTVELVVTVAVYRGIASVARSLDVPMEETYGRWEPDGRAPIDA
jgi:alkylhydroperoxidase family enzyme